MTEALGTRLRRELGLVTAFPDEAIYASADKVVNTRFDVATDQALDTAARFVDTHLRPDDVSLVLQRLGHRWRPASQALHDAGTGRATLLEPGLVDLLRPFRGDADALIGHLLTHGAAHGSEHVPRAPRTLGNHVTLLRRNEQVLPRLYDDIANAKHSITIAQFNWEPDGGGARILELLEQKAREGLDVRVMIDGWGFGERGWGAAREMQRRLEAAGAKVERSWGMLPGGVWEHRKLVEIDDWIAYAGGLGFGAKYDTWTDVMLRMEGPVGAVGGAHALTTWRDLSGPLDARAAARLGSIGAKLREAAVANASRESLADAGAAVTLLENRPNVDLAATESFLRDAATAKHRLWATSTYATSPDAIRALADAARRGVDVKLVVSGPGVGFDEPFIRLGRTHYRELLDAGVEIYERTTMTHAKGWMADDVVTVGSMNLSHSSMTRAREVMARVEDATLAADYASFHTELRSEAVRVGESVLAERGVRALTAARRLLRLKF